jgi:hypothetical protein
MSMIQGYYRTTFAAFNPSSAMKCTGYTARIRVTLEVLRSFATGSPLRIATAESGQPAN